MLDDDVYTLITVRRGNHGVVSRGQYLGSKVLVKSQFKVEADDFVISKRQIVHQACGIVPKTLDGAIVSNEYDVFKPSPDCCIRYFDYFSYRPEMRHAFFLSCVGVHLEKMLFRTNDWLKRRIYFPTLPEQRKIADFLTAVDGRIQQLSQKEALLQDYKKGVMQQLFTQALRFKDDLGNEFPDWEEKRVEEMFQVTRGKVLAMPETHSQRSPEFQYPVYSSQTSNNGLAGYYDTFLFRDAITWTTDGANAGDVKFRKGEFYCTNVCGVLLSDNGYANEFVAAMLGTVTRKHVSYVGNPKLMNNVMSQISISVPSSLAEQTKIANFLTALDRKIESVSQQIALTQTFKRGLLQQMFV